MAHYQAKNLVKGVLDSAMTSGQTTVVLGTGHGARFPDTTNGEYEITIWSASYNSAPDALNDSAAEIVLVTSHDGASDTLAVVTRAQGGTSAIAHAAGAFVELAFTKLIYDDLVTLAQKQNHHVHTTQFTRPLYYPHIGSYNIEGLLTPVSTTIYKSNFVLFVPERTGTIDELMWVRNITGGTNGARFAVYDTISDTNLAPGLRLYTSGQIGCTTLGASATSRWVCDPSALKFKKGKVYWLAGTLSNSVAMKGMAPNVGMPIVGVDWVDVSSYNPWSSGLMAPVSNYYDNGFPADFSALDLPLGTGNIIIFWIHWAT